MLADTMKSPHQRQISPLVDPILLQCIAILVSISFMMRDLHSSGVLTNPKDQHRTISPCSFGIENKRRKGIPPVGRVVPEVELLDVCHCLHQQPKYKEDPTLYQEVIQMIERLSHSYRYVPSSPVSEDFTRGGVDEDDRKADGEDPNCLEYKL